MSQSDLPAPRLPRRIRLTRLLPAAIATLGLLAGCRSTDPGAAATTVDPDPDHFLQGRLADTPAGADVAPLSPAETATPAPAPAAKATWWETGLITRGDWTVRQLADGRYRAMAVLDGSTHSRWLVAIAESRDVQDWPDWIGRAFPEPTLAAVVELDKQSGQVLQTYVYGDDTIRDGGQKGVRLAEPDADQSIGVQHLNGLLDGVAVAQGEDLYAPVPLPDHMHTAEQDTWLGFMGYEWTDKENVTPVQTGFNLFAVGALSAMDAAGVRKGDTIIAIGPLPRDHELMGKLYVGVANRFRVGDPLYVEWIHPEANGEYVIKSATVTVPALPMPRTPLSARVSQDAARLAEIPKSPDETLFDQMTRVHGQDEPWTDLRRRLDDLNDRADPYRLPGLTAVFRHPFAVEPVARGYLASVPTDDSRPPAELVAWSRGLLAQSTGIAEPPPAWTATDDLKAHVDYMEAALNEAAEHHTRAFAALTPDELAFLRGQADDYLQSFVDAHMMIYNPLDEQRENIRLLQIATKVDVGALLDQGQAMARLAAPDFLASLKTAMEASGKTGNIMARNTPHGRIQLTGTDDNKHRGSLAILVDLGGDDQYINNNASPVPGKIPSAMIIDFSGNDRYESWQLGAQGAGLFGCGILVDLAGDDAYTCIRGGQGFGFFGVGILRDAAGRDEFRAIDYSQGVGQFGLGLLIAGSGDKRYEGHTTCQGVGFTMGVGLLLGGTGDDSYYNKGQYASGYRDAGSFEGWGQGLGTGHRPYASGGVGLLVDNGGDDRYEGGCFSGGGGYYYGFGIQQDRAGDDHYRGSRYNQGFTAHQAVGVFIEDGGNDRYDQLVSVGQGMAWDESCTLFIEAGGDDIYNCPGFAFGASAMNGFTLFKDLGGSDQYTGPRPGEVTGNSYHGGSSVGYFLDLGPGQDTMHAKREGQVTAVDKDVAYFVHAPDIATAAASVKAPEPEPEPPTDDSQARVETQ